MCVASSWQAFATTSDTARGAMFGMVSLFQQSCMWHASVLFTERRADLMTDSPGQEWTHEDASEMMFDDLVEKNGIQIEQDDINFIKDLIKGKPRHSEKK